MVATVPGTHAGEGLRPIDIARDVPQIVDLLRLVFGEALEIDGQQIFGPQVSGLLYRINPATARLSNGYVWQADGHIVGNVTLLPSKAWDRYLVANVAVHPDYRRRGIARALMQTVTSGVRSRGGRDIMLQVVRDNTPAIDLYRSLGYVSIGHITTWHAPASRLRALEPTAPGEPDSDIRPLPASRWREAYDLDIARVPADLNWPDPLRPDAYRQSLWQRLGDVMNSRHLETWAIVDESDRLAGLATISGQWGRSHLLALRVRADWAGRLERPLLAKALRRLRYLPRRNVRVDHPEEDAVVNGLLREANFAAQRTLTHMQLNLVPGGAKEP